MLRIIMAMAMLISVTMAKADTINKDFSGNGIQITRPFSVPDGWEIQWSNQDFLQIFVWPVDGGSPEIVANQTGPGNGTSYQPKGGSYYLKVNGIGDWTIKVVKIN